MKKNNSTPLAILHMQSIRSEYGIDLFSCTFAEQTILIYLYFLEKRGLTKISNMSDTAKHIGFSRMTFYRVLKKLIDRGFLSMQKDQGRIHSFSIRKQEMMIAVEGMIRRIKEK
jgi:DNA-binding MarR family transcriptional regulator